MFTGVRFRISATELSFDAEKFKASLQKSVEVNIRQAARAFIRAAIQHVPIQTGMAVGSYLNIGQFLRVAVPIGPGPHGSQMSYRHSDGTFYPYMKGPDLGATFGIKPEDAFVEEAGRYTFKFESKVYHYILNEFGFKWGPWNSLVAGRQAAAEYAKTNFMKNMPKLKKFLIKTTITNGNRQQATLKS